AEFESSYAERTRLALATAQKADVSARELLAVADDVSVWSSEVCAQRGARQQRLTAATAALSEIDALGEELKRRVVPLPADAAEVVAAQALWTATAPPLNEWRASLALMTGEGTDL